MELPITIVSFHSAFYKAETNENPEELDWNIACWELSSPPSRLWVKMFGESFGPWFSPPPTYYISEDKYLCIHGLLNGTIDGCPILLTPVHLQKGAFKHHLELASTDANKKCASEGN